MTTNEPFGCAIDRHRSMIRALSSRCYTIYHHQHTHTCHQKQLLQSTSMEPSTTPSFFHPKRSQFATDGKQDRKNTRESGQHKPVGRTKASWVCALVSAHAHHIDLLPTWLIGNVRVLCVHFTWAHAHTVCRIAHMHACVWCWLKNRPSLS